MPVWHKPATRHAGSPIVCCEPGCHAPVAVAYEGGVGRCATHAADVLGGRITPTPRPRARLADLCRRPGCDRRRTTRGRFCLRHQADALLSAPSRPLVIEPLDTSQPIRHVPGGPPPISPESSMNVARNSPDRRPAAELPPAPNAAELLARLQDEAQLPVVYSDVMAWDEATLRAVAIWLDGGRTGTTPAALVAIGADANLPAAQPSPTPEPAPSPAQPACLIHPDTPVGPNGRICSHCWGNLRAKARRRKERPSYLPGPGSQPGRILLAIDPQDFDGDNELLQEMVAMRAELLLPVNDADTSTDTDDKVKHCPGCGEPVLFASGGLRDAAPIFCAGCVEVAEHALGEGDTDTDTPVDLSIVDEITNDGDGSTEDCDDSPDEYSHHCDDCGGGIRPDETATFWGDVHDRRARCISCEDIRIKARDTDGDGSTAPPPATSLPGMLPILESDPGPVLDVSPAGPGNDSGDDGFAGVLGPVNTGGDGSTVVSLDEQLATVRRQQAELAEMEVALMRRQQARDLADLVDARDDAILKFLVRDVVETLKHEPKGPVLLNALDNDRLTLRLSDALSLYRQDLRRFALTGTWPAAYTDTDTAREAS